MPAPIPAVGVSEGVSKGPTLADLMESFRQAGDAAAAAVREHFAPLLPLTSGLVMAQEAIERDSRRARQRENSREFRRTVARRRQPRGL